MSQESEPGEFARLVDGLDAPTAEMLAEDLRDLSVPIRVELDEATATFAVHVPAGSHEIALRVLAGYGGR